MRDNTGEGVLQTERQNAALKHTLTQLCSFGQSNMELWAPKLKIKDNTQYTIQRQAFAMKLANRNYFRS